MKFCSHFLVRVSSRVCVCFSTTMMMMTMMMMMMMMTTTLACVVLRPRIANRLVKGSYCRGGIVNIRFGCSTALLVQPESPTALWRFRVSTSNSPSGRTGPHDNTPIRYIYYTYAQQDIRVYEGDHFQPPMRQFSNPKALWLLRVSI